MRCAFYGRVSTEDQQDPEASRNWQLDRSRQLIGPAGGEIVEEFCDIGQSRSLPWKRRPEAARLLRALADPARGFEAVVIGEPQRAFHGNQFSLTFPIFGHHCVALWVPEVGGAIDSESEAHDLVMTIFGGMSKGERTRIKTRVRSAMGSQARHQGRFLGGRPPYGYLLADAGEHPNPAKAADGKRLHRLEVDPVAAPVVRRIFDEYTNGAGLYAIAEGLSRDDIPSPSAHDPERNRHRRLSNGAWSKSAVRAILANPRYTGFQVWNKQRRDEVLLDIDDVAQGHSTKMRWNDTSAWIFSESLAHEPIIDREAFDRSRALAATRATGRGPRTRSTPRPYVLRGLLQCGTCGRRMQAQWSNSAPYYRCRYPAEYALTNDVDHPKTIYVRQDEIVPALDRWLSTVFDPANIEETCALLAAANDADQPTASRAQEAAAVKLAQCDQRLDQYRKALDSGADPAVVAGWIGDVQRERSAAERVLATRDATRPITRDDIRRMVDAVEDKVQLLADADATTKAALYGSLGISLCYEHDRRVVTVEARQPGHVHNERVGGGT
jgi:site-specific DNA recombinase